VTSAQVLTLAAVVAIALGAANAAAQTPTPFDPPTLAGADRAALQKLHDADAVDLQMGELAQDKGSTRTTRSLGRQLVADEAVSERKIDAYLRKRGTDLSALATTTNADPDHELLATRSGLEFDRAFATQAVTDHEKTLELIESARVETGDDTLRMLYDELETTVRAHKRAAEQLLAESARS
jgi:putative membrane protein